MLATNENIVPGTEEHRFDIVIRSQPQENTTGLKNLGGLLFRDLKHRSNHAIVLAGHVEEKYKEITLHDLRSIVATLYKKFTAQGLKKGHTVLLASLESNSELYIAILFLALTSYGIKVFLPMYIEKEALGSWHSNLRLDFIIFPGNEIDRLEYHTRQKQSVMHLSAFANNNKIPCLDINVVFQLDILIDRPPDKSNDFWKKQLNIASSVPENQTALLITTSGTSGESKIVYYDHRSFLINISAWENAGLFNPDLCGGRGLTPLLTHTMGLRTFLNAVWLGKAAILINTEWYTQKPEAVSYLLKKTKPEHITAGPAVFNLLLEISRIYPDLKQSLRNSLKTIVSSGAAYNEEIISKMREAFNVNTHNAFGTTETQQVLNTVLSKRESDVGKNHLGNVLPGVAIALSQIDNSKSYKMYIKSEFGGTRFLEDGTSKYIRNNYVYLGDIVKYDGQQLEYEKREKDDIINDEFGMKVPLKKLLLNYKRLVGRFSHLKILPLKFKPGLSVILFVNDGSDQLLRNVEKEAHLLIEKTNNELYQSFEPLQFNHWIIKRFAVVNSESLKKYFSVSLKLRVL